MCPPPEVPALRVYSRQGCHLCELLVEELIPLVRDRLPLEIIDIGDHDDLEARYGTRIPVVEYRGEQVCQYRLDRSAVAELLENHAPPQG